MPPRFICLTGQLVLLETLITSSIAPSFQPFYLLLVFSDLCFAMMMKRCIPATCLLSLVSYFKFLIKEAFTRLGLLRPPPQEDYYSANHFDGYVLLTDSRSRSLVPVPLQVVTAMIKKNLEILEYGDFIERFGDERMENNRVCTVCLDSMEKSDEMRKLCKCSHVFHRDCLDTWVNEGQLTCPLCRSTLYPDQIDCNRLTECHAKS